MNRLHTYTLAVLGAAVAGVIMSVEFPLAEPAGKPSAFFFAEAQAQQSGGRGGGPQGRFGPQFGGLGGGGRSGSAYWGGRNLPEPPTLDDETLPQGVTTSPEDSATEEGATADQVWCTGYSAGMAANDRFSGINLRRLEALEAVLAPKFDHRNAKEPILILASYQEELEKQQPDRAVAGIYLGLVSTVPITARVVQLSNRYLCVAKKDNGENNAVIATIAETQRVIGRAKSSTSQ